MEYLLGLSRYLPDLNLPFKLKEKEVAHFHVQSVTSALPPVTCHWEAYIVRLAGISGALAVSLGAYGSHVLRERSVSERRLRAFETGNRYHLVHSLALLSATKSRFPLLTAVLFLAGITIFSGSIYHYSLSGKEFLRRYTPLGGILFIIGWVSMLF